MANATAGFVSNANSLHLGPTYLDHNDQQGYCHGLTWQRLSQLQ
jgi:hypothetical protein